MATHRRKSFYLKLIEIPNFTGMYVFESVADTYYRDFYLFANDGNDLILHKYNDNLHATSHFIEWPIVLAGKTWRKLEDKPTIIDSYSFRAFIDAKRSNREWIKNLDFPDKYKQMFKSGILYKNLKPGNACSQTESCMMYQEPCYYSSHIETNKAEHGSAYYEIAMLSEEDRKKLIAISHNGLCIKIAATEHEENESKCVHYLFSWPVHLAEIHWVKEIEHKNPSTYEDEGLCFDEVMVNQMEYDDLCDRCPYANKFKK